MNSHQLLPLFLIVVFAGTVNINAYAQSEQRSAPLTRHIENPDGSLNYTEPQRMTYTALLNSSRDSILIENSPLWNGENTNISGNGYFTVQFGNFPQLSVGDTMMVRMTDQSHRLQGKLEVVADTLPWSDPNPLNRLQLSYRDLPPKPQNVRIRQRTSGAYEISWDSAGASRYRIYRRSWADTLENGKRRNIYVRVADSLKKNHYVDEPPKEEIRYSYIVYSINERGTISGHSRPSSRKTRLLRGVPQPIIPSRPTLIDMYNKGWTLALQNSKHGQPGSGFVDWYLDEAFDNRLFQWDVCFMMTFAKYSQGALPNIETLDNFYRHQHPDGAIAGVINEWNGEDSPPSKQSPYFTRNNLFAWAEWEYYQATGDSSRFDRVIPILAEYARWVRGHRRHPNGHFWWSGFGSGMDNSPRSTATNDYPPYGWVDYDANEAMAARYLVKMARVAGRDRIVDEFSQFRDTMETLVNRDMWSGKDQFYWDIDRDGSFMKIEHPPSGEKRKVMSVASFWPLWADITSAEQTDGLIGHLKNDKEFDRPHRVPTLAADDLAYSPEGNYWRGSVWPPTNHMIVEGLMTQDRYKMARKIVANHLNMVARVFQKTGTLWENYAPESANPGNQAKPDFVGWSAVGPIAQLIENYIGIIPKVPDNTIRWNLLTTREVGLENLQMGDYTIGEIRAKARSSKGEPIELVIDTPEPFTLHLFNGKQDTTIQVKAGSREIIVTSASSEGKKIPDNIQLKSNYPNPFNPTTRITYAVPRATKVTLSVYITLGRRVATLVDRKVGRGKHAAVFRAENLSSGLYFYRLHTSGITLSRKMLLLK